jgi:hypothetical protein
MKKILLAFTFLLSAAFVTDALGQGSLAGVYAVTGTNPGGKGAYKGIATIVKSGDNYRIHWEVGTTYDGIGKLNGKVFTVEWGTSTANVGTVTYNLQPDGSLKGTWFVAKNPSELGTENLVPKK